MSADPNTFSQAGALGEWYAAIAPNAPDTPPTDRTKSLEKWMAAQFGTPLKPEVVPRPAIAAQPAASPADVVALVVDKLMLVPEPAKWAAEFVRCNPGFDREAAEVWLAKAMVCGFAQSTWAAERKQLADAQALNNAGIGAGVARAPRKARGG